MVGREMTWEEKKKACFAWGLHPFTEVRLAPNPGLTCGTCPHREARDRTHLRWGCTRAKTISAQMEECVPEQVACVKHPQARKTA